jgi:hypothetical protein
VLEELAELRERPGQCARMFADLDDAALRRCETADFGRLRKLRSRQNLLAHCGDDDPDALGGGVGDQAQRCIDRDAGIQKGGELSGQRSTLAQAELGLPWVRRCCIAVHQLQDSDPSVSQGLKSRRLADCLDAPSHSGAGLVHSLIGEMHRHSPVPSTRKASATDVSPSVTFRIAHSRKVSRP